VGALEAGDTPMKNDDLMESLRQAISHLPPPRPKPKILTALEVILGIAVTVGMWILGQWLFGAICYRGGWLEALLGHIVCTFHI
jgi:hypothetical protein